MNAPNPNQADASYPDETPRSVESSQETPMERQEKKLENKEKEQPEASTSQKTITDLEQERQHGSREDAARTDGPYGVQEPEAEQ